MADPRPAPYLGVNFQVHLELNSVIVAGFAEVSGLEMELGTEPYEEGGVNGFTHTLPTRFSYPNLVFRRGLTDSTDMLEWLQTSREGTVERLSGTIFLNDSFGEPTWSWTFVQAYPVKWTGPDLRADQGAVAMESLELVHEGLTAEGPSDG